MKIKATILMQIAGSNQLKARLQSEFNRSPFTIHKWIKDNAENGDLTTATALKIIGEELELTNDQILEQTKTAA